RVYGLKRVKNVNGVKRMMGVKRVSRVKNVNRVNRVRNVNRVKRVNSVQRVKMVNLVKNGKSPQRSAASASTRPKPHALSKFPGPSFTAVLVRQFRMAVLVKPGWRLHISATRPVTRGVAMDVPSSSS